MAIPNRVCIVNGHSSNSGLSCALRACLFFRQRNHVGAGVIISTPIWWRRFRYWSLHLKQVILWILLQVQGKMLSRKHWNMRWMRRCPFQRIFLVLSRLSPSLHNNILFLFLSPNSAPSRGLAVSWAISWQLSSTWKLTHWKKLGKLSCDNTSLWSCESWHFTVGMWLDSLVTGPKRQDKFTSAGAAATFIPWILYIYKFQANHDIEH